MVVVFCRGHGATREAAQGAEIRPAAEVSRASPSWVGRPVDNLRVRAGPERAGNAVGPPSGLPPGRAVSGSGAGTRDSGLEPGVLLQGQASLPRGAHLPCTLCAVRGARSERQPFHQGGCGPHLAAPRRLVLLNEGITISLSWRPRVAPSVRYCSKPALSNRNIMLVSCESHMSLYIF